MKHPDTSCDCAAAVTAKTAIRKVSILAAVCDGVTIRKAEPNGKAATAQRILLGVHKQRSA
jgi:hypothetical protein